jgi:hypothetical protein
MCESEIHGEIGNQFWLMRLDERVQARSADLFLALDENLTLIGSLPVVLMRHSAALT